MAYADVPVARPGKPTYGVRPSPGHERGLGWIRFDRSDVPKAVDSLKGRIRRLAWLERAGPAEFEEISRTSRMCYELSQGAEVASLSLEDVEILYAIPGLDGFANEALNWIRPRVRESRSSNPVTVDRLAKGIEEMLEG